MAQDEQVEAFLTVAEVAELLKLNQQTVRNWIDQGSMPAIRIGRRVRIKKSDLDRVLASGYQGAPALRDPDLGGPCNLLKGRRLPGRVPGREGGLGGVEQPGTVALGVGARTLDLNLLRH